MKITSHHVRPVLCAALTALSTLAAAGVNKCIDQNGEVLYTDIDCPSGSQLVEPVSSDTQSSQGGVEHLSYAAPATSAPRSRWADMPHPVQRRTVSLDTSTLQTARVNLQIEDEARKQAHLLSAR